MRRWRSILRLPRLRLPTPSCTLALSVRTRSEGERRYVSFAPVSTPYTRRALFHCSGSSATPSDTIITTRPYRAHRLLQPHLTVRSVEEALRPVSTRPAAYRRRRTICRLHLKPTVRFVRAPERRRATFEVRCNRGSPAARCPCLSVCPLVPTSSSQGRKKQKSNTYFFGIWGRTTELFKTELRRWLHDAHLSFVFSVPTVFPLPFASVTLPSLGHGRVR